MRYNAIKCFSELAAAKVALNEFQVYFSQWADTIFRQPNHYRAFLYDPDLPSKFSRIQ
jgi:hypothetical protein